MLPPPEGSLCLLEQWSPAAPMHSARSAPPPSFPEGWQRPGQRRLVVMCGHREEVGEGEEKLQYLY